MSVKCPNCGNNLINIIYGRPNQELIEQAKEGKIILGGCIINKNMPNYHCNYCNKNYKKSQNQDETKKDSLYKKTLLRYNNEPS